LHSGATATWAPAGIAALGGQFFFAGLRGEALYSLEQAGQGVKGLTAHFFEEFGRLRAVAVGPDGWLYLSTSNKDGRGDVRDGDDKIIRVNPKMLLR
jgi:glucose/arabinose dehydrogenase